MKVIANQLKAIIRDVVDSFQSACLITDNALVAFELFHYMRTRGPSSRPLMSLKPDMAKAYDRVEWSFLENMLLKLGFLPAWVSLVMACVR